ncbi:autolysin [Staphylococcus ursi]|uniref:GW dipeptide domain-containing protein n=1 Tax=Staphylococcus sp. MI 10-1553 TaxID=1912064 RepID=UPI001398C4B1|nr:GW dipeptide domain-containing protein [Staphylococcus sp. MI 10-1553]QHW36537.1 autolysin [Staphylococcus sp. MI 10-1553]
MVKKFGYKTPTIVALTLAGTAFSAHQANAAEQVVPEKTPTNVLDDQYALKQVDDAKQTTQATTLAGSKEYKDPSQIDTAQTETRVEEGQQDAQQLAPTDEVTSTDSTVSKGTDESASPALASTDEGTLNAQLHSDEMANNHTQDTTEDATQYPYSSSEIDTHEDATVSPDTYHAPDTHAQQPSSTDVSDSTTAKSDVTQANTSTNPNEKNAVSTTEDAFATQPQADVQPEVNKETKAATETAQNSTPQVNAKDTTQVENKATETQNTAQSATGNQESTEQLAKRTSVTNEAKMDATSAKTLAPASTTRQADTQAKTTADKKAPSVKATTDSAQTATDKDINANPDGPTPPRVGGKGGPPASLSLQSTGQTAFRSAVASKPSAYQPKVKSPINDYIRKQKYNVPVYEEDYSSYFPKYGYRNGVGKPEGIVVHDTANNYSTIDDEISYMKRNYQSAFVHGFINGQRIVETQPTDYLAWGAGAVANERFIHIELVHVHSKEDFARQMNNMADYAATNLQYYGLSPDSAEYDGYGTVWTHDAVSRFLGGTDHTDPHGYLKQHGYSFDELYDLINEKYQVKMGYASPANSSSTPSKPSTNTGLTVKNTTGYGRINTTNSGLYTTVYDQKGKATNRTNQTLKVTKEATLNGKKFYLMNDAKSNQTLGWVKSNDATYQTAQAEKKVTKTYTVKPGTTVYQVPWGTSSQTAGKVAGKTNQSFKSMKEQTVAKTKWLYGTVGKITGWIDASNVVANDQKPSTNTALKVTTDTGLGRIKDKNSGLYATVYDKTGKSTSATNQTFKVTKKASVNGQSFYLVSDYAKGTNIGWVKQSDVDYQTSKAPSKVNQNYTIKSGAKLYQVPWGTSKQVAGTVTGDALQTFKATQSQTVGKATYLYGTVGKLSGWINSTALTVQKAAASSITKTVSQIGQLNTKNSGVKASIYDKTAKDAAKWAGQTYKITKTASANNEDYVLLQNHTGGTPLGWFNVKDVTTRSLGTETAVKGHYTINGKTSGLYSMPWGTTKQRVDTLKNAASRLFTASKSVKVGNDTFLFGTVNQKLGWINQKDLTVAVAKVANIKTASNSAVKGAAITTLKQVEDYVITNKNGYYYIKVGNSKTAGALKGFYQQIFKVEKTSLLNGITWYYGTFQNGTKGWIKAADVRSLFIQHTAVSSTLKEALDKQMALSYPPQVQHVAGKWVNANRAETEKAMNTEALEKDPTLIYQFLKLDTYQGLGAEELNELLKGKGILEGQGAAFKEAAQKHNINEIYLISHALLETGNGTSQLANGGHVDKNNKVVTTGEPKYYNMFGIGAIDTDALRNGFKTAEKYGWNTVSKAIIGGAEFIRDRYIGSGQNTLYRMRWNPEHPATHQYATDINWANVNAQRMKSFYDQIGETGKYFDVDVYKK